MNEKAISEKELLAAIKDLLKKNGYLNKINAEVSHYYYFTFTNYTEIGESQHDLILHKTV